MKLLFLGNSSTFSQDSRDHRTGSLSHLLSDQLGTPVEITAREIWPDARLPAFTDRLISREQPDIVYFNITDYAIAYPSTAVRLRRFGRIGRWAANRSLLFADSQASHNAPVRAVRWLLQATLGGEPHVPVDEGIQNFLETIRAAARHEAAFVMVDGPRAMGQYGATGRQNRIAEATRLRLHHALRDTCASLHIHYTGYDTPIWADPTSPLHHTHDEFGGDGIHLNETAAQRHDRIHANAIAAAYREHLAPRG